jgi:hypothetical protein
MFSKTVGQFRFSAKTKATLREVINDYIYVGIYHDSCSHFIEIRHVESLHKIGVILMFINIDKLQRL